jgi:ADP-heptose:LPS heptosyltransferase
MKPLNPVKMKVAKILQPLWWFIGLFMNDPKSDAAIKSILIFDFHLIGDMVLLIPLLDGIRTKYPEANVVLVAGPWAQDIVLPSGFIDELIPFSAPWVKYGQGWGGWASYFSLLRVLRTRSWDMGVEIRGDIRQILLLALAGAKVRVGLDITGGGPLLTKVVPIDNKLVHIADFHKRIGKTMALFSDSTLYHPKLTLTEKEKIYAKKISPYIGIHFGASVNLRRVPLNKAQKLLSAIYSLYPDKNYVVFELKEDPIFSKELFKFLNSKTKKIEFWVGGLRDFIVKASCCEHMYAMDSAAAHISCALGVKTSVIYGPSNDQLTSPIGENGQIILVKNKPNCWPCNQRKCISTENQACFPEDLSCFRPLVQI